MKRLTGSFLAIVAGLWIGIHPALGSESKVGVVASILPVAYVAQELGGERAQVDVLVPPGASPHTFEPVPSDMVKLQRARLFLKVGAGLDAWSDRLRGAGSGELERVTLISVPGLKPLEGGHDHHDHGHGKKHDDHGHDQEKKAEKHDDHGHDEKHAKKDDHHGHDHGEKKAKKHDDHGHEEKHAKHDDHGHDEKKAEKHHDHGHDEKHAKKHDDHGHDEKKAEKHDDHGHEKHAEESGEGMDPHFWLDPIRVRDAVVPVIVEHLIEADPAGKEYYEKRGQDFHKRLTALDVQVRRELAKAKGRKYVAFHNAWVYFSERYNVEEVAVVQEFAGEEPTPREVAALVQGAREAGIRNILVEPQFSPRVAQTIASEFGGGTVMVDPLGDSGDPARSSYEKLMLFNARAFAQALGGKN